MTPTHPQAKPATGGAYEVTDGAMVRVQEPTAPCAPGPAAKLQMDKTTGPTGAAPAEAGPGAAVGAAHGEPLARAEDAPAAPGRKRAG